MVHFPTLSSTAYVFSGGSFGISQRGFPHSEIPGSKLICSSPGLIAAYRVLHRLQVPRHSPYTLSSLTIRNSNLRLRASGFHPKPACESFMHTACVWSEKTTVCRIFSCQRIRLRPLGASGTSRALRLGKSLGVPSRNSRRLENRRQRSGGWWRIPGSNR